MKYGVIKARIEALSSMAASETMSASKIGNLLKYAERQKKKLLDLLDLVSIEEPDTIRCKLQTIGVFTDKEQTEEERRAEEEEEDAERLTRLIRNITQKKRNLFHFDESFDPQQLGLRANTADCLFQRCRNKIDKGHFLLKTINLHASVRKVRKTWVFQIYLHFKLNRFPGALV